MVPTHSVPRRSTCSAPIAWPRSRTLTCPARRLASPRGVPAQTVPRRSSTSAVTCASGMPADDVVGGHLAADRAQQPAAQRAEPEGAVVVLEHRHDHDAGERPHVGRAARTGCRRSAPARRRVADPEAIVRVLEEREDRVARQPVAGGVGLDPPVAHARQPAAVRADPQAAVAGREELADLNVAERRGRRLVVGRELMAVEPGQALAGAEPEEAVARLGDGLDAVLRQALARLPDVVMELRQRLVGRERRFGRQAPLDGLRLRQRGHAEHDGSGKHSERGNS